MNRNLRRLALCLSVFPLVSNLCAIPAVLPAQTPPPAPPQSPADKAATDELDRINTDGRQAYGKGDFPAALKAFQTGLEKAQALKNEKYIAQFLNNIGNDYYTLGQNDKALDFYQRGLTLREKIGNQSDIAMSLNNIGLVYASLGQNDKALDYEQRALTLKEKIGNPQDIASSLTNIGAVDASLGQNDKALDYDQRALTLREKIGNQSDIAMSLNNIGFVYASLGQYDKALDFYQRALTLKEKIGNQSDIIASLNNIGNVYGDMKQWDKAEDTYSRTRRIFENFSQQVGDPTQLADLQQTMGHFYEWYADVLTQEKRPDEALSLLEAGRVQGLARQIDLNGRDYTRWFSAADAATLKQRAAELAAASNLLRTAETRLAAASSVDRAACQKARDEQAQKQAEAEQRCTQFRDTLFARYPQFRNEEGERPPTPRDLRSLANSNPDTLFLTWAMLNNKRADLYVIGSREKETLQGLTLSVGEADLQKMAAAWREAMGAGNRGIAAANAPEEKDEETQAKALYAALFGPIEKAGLLAKGRYKRIVVVPSGPLLELPFAALMDSEGRRLIENYAVSSKMALSTTFWRANPNRPKTQMLCIADPIRTAPTKAEQVAVRRAGFGPLPGARQEGQAVAELFHTAALVGPQARKAAVLSAIADAKFLHFATHGYLNPKSPFYSGLVLAPEPADSLDDGVLSAREILNLPLAAQLAVLSACETGRGVAKGGDGLQGLVWAFQAAGCPCVVASQWQVDDAATRDLMLGFYRNLLAGQRKDDALRNAMLMVKAKPGKASPFYWAAFQVIGDTTPLSKQEAQAP